VHCRGGNPVPPGTVKVRPTVSAGGRPRRETRRIDELRKELTGMSQENQITLRGFVTAEPKFKQTALTATPLAEIRVGSTPRRLDRETGEWRELPTTYYTIKCWRRLAVNAASSLHKGDMVLVRGRFSVHNWVDNEQRPRVTIEIEADSLGHDLTYGWSHFLRGSHPSGRAGVNAGETARQDTGESDRDYAASDGHEEYSSDGDWDESLRAVVATDSQQDLTGEGDPTPAAPVTVGDGDLVEPGDVPVAPGLASGLNLPDTDAVPF
jgi:single-strand DNA-binding protein